MPCKKEERLTWFEGVLVLDLLSSIVALLEACGWATQWNECSRHRPAGLRLPYKKALVCNFMRLTWVCTLISSFVKESLVPMR